MEEELRQFYKDFPKVFKTEEFLLNFFYIFKITSAFSGNKLLKEKLSGYYFIFIGVSSLASEPSLSISCINVYFFFYDDFFNLCVYSL